MIRRQLLHPATVIATIALIVALGGTSYAVTQLPRNSVGTKQLKNGAVTAAKVKKASLTADVFAPQALAGAAGPQGPAGAKGDTGAQGAPGPQGPAGSARAFATVRDDGSLVTSRSRSVVSSAKLEIGKYCVIFDDAIGIDTMAPVATVDYNFSGSGLTSATSIEVWPSTSLDCAGVIVYTMEISVGVVQRTNAGFHLLIP